MNIPRGMFIPEAPLSGHSDLGLSSFYIRKTGSCRVGGGGPLEVIWPHLLAADTSWLLGTQRNEALCPVTQRGQGSGGWRLGFDPKHGDPPVLPSEGQRSFRLASLGLRV